MANGQLTRTAISKIPSDPGFSTTMKLGDPGSHLFAFEINAAIWQTLACYIRIDKHSVALFKNVPKNAKDSLHRNKNCIDEKAICPTGCAPSRENLRPWSRLLLPDNFATGPVRLQFSAGISSFAQHV